MIRTKMLTALAATAAWGNPALAQTSGTGLRVELSTGYDALSNHDSYEDTPDTLDGVRLGGAIGYDVLAGPVLIGIEAGIGWTLKDRKSVTLGNDRLSLYTGRDLDLSLRIGTPAGPRTILYAKAGYANSRITAQYDARIIGGYDTEHFRANGDGLRLGLGVEQGLWGRVYGKAEYRWTRYFGRFDYQERPTRNQLLLGVGVRF